MHKHGKTEDRIWSRIHWRPPTEGAIYGATSKCICGVQPPENDLTTIFVRYFLYVRSSVVTDPSQTHTQTSEYRATQLVSSIKHKLSHAIPE